MVVIHVSAIVEYESAATFEQSLRSIIRDAKATKGCIKYEWYRDPDAQNRYVMYGEFDSEENFGEYLKSSVVRRIGEELIPLIEGGPKFKHFRATLMDGR